MTSRKSVLCLLIALTAIVGLGAWPTSAAAEKTEVVVYAAASTTNALTEIAELFAARKMGRIKTSFASSSTLAKQIENGAPADLFLSANQKWMDYLEGKNFIAKETRFDFLRNRIVLIAPKQSDAKEIEVGPGLVLTAMLGKDGRLAMGDPAHVPAGIYGQKALENLGVWNSVENRLAPMKDVRAALALVEREETPLGLVYATDAAASERVRVVGLFPETSHPPIGYPLAAVAGKNISAARQVIAFLKSAQSVAIFKKYGFMVP